MGIDILTLIFITGISHLMQVLVLFYQNNANKNMNGPGWWLAWSAAESFAFLLILLRSIPALLPYIIIFQNIIIFSGGLFIYIGILRFFEKKVNLRFIFSILASFIILHLSFIYIKDDMHLRTLILNIYISLIAFITAVSIYRNKTASIASTANFNTVLFVIHGSIFAYRSIMISTGTPLEDMFATSLFNMVQYFDALITGLLWTFGFIIMLNQRLNNEISETKAHFEQIFNTSPDAVIITRLSDGLFVDCNDSCTRITGYSKADILEKSSYEIDLWKNPEERNEVIKMIRDKGFTENYEALYQRKDGSDLTVLVSGKKIMLRGIPHVISVARDISDRKIAEEEVKLRNDQLQKLNREKDKFFSIIAHDLRNPFNSFLGLTQIMVEDLPGLTMAELKSFTVRLKDSAVNLFRLLENLLEWSGMQQGLIPFNPKIIKLRAAADESLAFGTEPARAKGIKLTCNINEAILVLADIKMLQTVLRNLISNAIKFTADNGTILVSAEVTGNKRIGVSVRDSGIGMSRSLIDNLFRLDVQTNRKGTNDEPSTGLGLLLCKEFIEKHGGELRIESEEGNGSLFSFSLALGSDSEDKALSQEARK